MIMFKQFFLIIYSKLKIYYKKQTLNSSALHTYLMANVLLFFLNILYFLNKYNFFKNIITQYTYT